MRFLEQVCAAALRSIHVGRIVYSVGIDDDALACCSFLGTTTMGATRCNLEPRGTETKLRSSGEIQNDFHHYYHQDRVSVSPDMKNVVVGLNNGAVCIWNSD